MNKGQKVALKHAANAIDGTRPNGEPIKLGASAVVSRFSDTDTQGRPFASVYLAHRAGFSPATQANAQANVANHFGLTYDQVQKLDRVAASTHNTYQRADRVAKFIRKVAENPEYIGLPSRSTTGAVAASL